MLIDRMVLAVLKMDRRKWHKKLAVIVGGGGSGEEGFFPFFFLQFPDHL